MLLQGGKGGRGRLPPEGVTVAGGSGRDPGGVHGDGSRWTGVYKQQQPQQQQHTFLLFAKLTVDITQRYVVPTLIPVAISYLLEATRSIGMVLRASEEFSPPFLPGLGCSAPIDYTGVHSFRSGPPTTTYLDTILSVYHAQTTFPPDQLNFLTFSGGSGLGNLTPHLQSLLPVIGT